MTVFNPNATIAELAAQQSPLAPRMLQPMQMPVAPQQAAQPAQGIGASMPTAANMKRAAAAVQRIGNWLTGPTSNGFKDISHSGTPDLTPGNGMGTHGDMGEIGGLGGSVDGGSGYGGFGSGYGSFDAGIGGLGGSGGGGYGGFGGGYGSFDAGSFGGFGGFAEGGIADMGLPTPDLRSRGLGSRGGISHFRAPHGGFARGLIHSPTGGRADHVGTQVRRGSYVVPADVVSGLGQGNTLAGGNVLRQVLGTHGQGLANGGMAGDDLVPVLLSGGEYVVEPEHVAAVGGAGVMDNLVEAVRAHTVGTLERLPPPK